MQEVDLVMIGDVQLLRKTQGGGGGGRGGIYTEQTVISLSNVTETATACSCVLIFISLCGKQDLTKIELPPDGL